MANRVSLMRKAESMLEVLYLIPEKELDFMYNAVFDTRLKEKMNEFDITPLFNFSLWRKLKDYKGYFNYMKISKRIDLKEKWFIMIAQEIPELLTIYDEVNQVFDYFKDALGSLFKFINCYEHFNEDKVKRILMTTRET